MKKKACFYSTATKLVKTVSPSVRKSVTESYTVLEALGIFLPNSQCYIAFGEFCSHTKLWQWPWFSGQGQISKAKAKTKACLLQGQGHKIWL